MDIRTKAIIERLLNDDTLTHEIKKYFIIIYFFALNQKAHVQREIATYCASQILKKITNFNYEIDDAIIEKELQHFFYVSILSGISQTNLKFFENLIDTVGPRRSGGTKTIEWFLKNIRWGYSDILANASSEKPEQVSISAQVEKNQGHILTVYLKNSYNTTDRTVGKQLGQNTLYFSFVSTFLIAMILNPTVFTLFLTFILSALTYFFAAAMNDLKRLRDQTKIAISQLVSLDIEITDSRQFQQKFEPPRRRTRHRNVTPNASIDPKIQLLEEVLPDNPSPTKTDVEPILVITAKAPEKENKSEEKAEPKKPKRRHQCPKEEDIQPELRERLDIPTPLPAAFGTAFEKLDPQFVVRVTSNSIGLNANSRLFTLWDDENIKKGVNFKSNAQSEAYDRLKDVFFERNTCGPTGENGVKYMRNLGLFAVKDRGTKARVYGEMVPYSDGSYIHFRIFSKNGTH